MVVVITVRCGNLHLHQKHKGRQKLFDVLGSLAKILNNFEFMGKKFNCFLEFLSTIVKNLAKPSVPAENNCQDLGKKSQNSRHSLRKLRFLTLGNHQSAYKKIEKRKYKNESLRFKTCFKKVLDPR